MQMNIRLGAVRVYWRKNAYIVFRRIASAAAADDEGATTVLRGIDSPLTGLLLNQLEKHKENQRQHTKLRRNCLRYCSM